jgi:hypothetical protein
MLRSPEQALQHVGVDYWKSTRHAREILQVPLMRTGLDHPTSDPATA